VELSSEKLVGCQIERKSSEVAHRTGSIHISLMQQLIDTSSMIVDYLKPELESVQR
jgi:hypothetical protein